jgi:hypothetical protein
LAAAWYRLLRLIAILFIFCGASESRFRGTLPLGLFLLFLTEKHEDRKT